MNQYKSPVTGLGFLLLVTALIYILLVIVPFYGNGIHLSYTKPFTSQFNATGYPPFSWVSWGRELWLWTHFVYIFGIFIGLPVLLLSLIGIGLRSSYYRPFSHIKKGIWGAATLLYCLAMWLTLLHKDAIQLWILD